MLDLYKILGIKKDASKDEIKQAYRDKAKGNHPDLGGDQKVMQNLNLAYSVLSDETKRAKYDQGEDPEKNTKDPVVTARQTLSTLIMECVRNEGFDLEHDSPLEHAKDTAAKTIENRKSIIKKADDHKTRISQFKKRLKKDPTNEMIHTLLSAAITELGSIKLLAEFDIDVYSKIIEMIASGDYTTEEKQQEEYVFIGRTPFRDSFFQGMQR